MWVTLITLCLATTVYARPEIIIPEESAVELQALAQPAPAELEEYLKEAQPEELNRKKKQITTFCVEIRSSEHRPFEICQPARSGGEKIKSDESEHSGAETHSKPAYPPVKTYQSPESTGPSSKQQFDDFRPNFPEVQNLGPARAAMDNEEMQAENEIPSTGAAKSAKEEMKFIVPALSRSAFDEENEQKDDEKISPARAATNPEPVPDVVNNANKEVDEINPETAKDTPKEAPKDELKETLKDEPRNAPEDAGDKPADTNLQETVKDNIEDSPSKMRADEHNDAYHHKDTYHHDDTYNHKPSYGHPTRYIPVTPTHNSHHSGLVITCQPNLAGYAHGVPGPYYHHEGHPSYNHRSASVPYPRHYPYRPQYGDYQNYGSYGNYGGYNKQYQPRPMYRPQAHSYQGPVYPYQHSKPHSMGPMHHKPIHTNKPLDNQKFFSQSQKFDSQQAFESPDLSEPGPSPAFFPQLSEHNREVHHERSSDVMGEENKIDVKPLDQETKEQHTLQKIESMSKERLAEHWVPEGMEEVIQAGEAREAVDEALEDPKAAEKEEEGPIPAFSEHEHSIHISAKEANGGGRSADYGPPPAEHEHSGHNGAKEAEGGGWRSADYGPPPAEHEHSSHIGAKEAEGGGWRSADFDKPPTEHERSSHSHVKEAEGGGGWRSADFDKPPIGDERSSHSHAKEAEGGDWRSAVYGPPAAEHEHSSHNGAKEANGEGWRSADYGPPAAEHEHSSHNGAKEAEGGGWRSADYGPPAAEHEHSSHNGAKEANGEGWRSADYGPPAAEHEHSSHIVEAEEGGGWRSASEGNPAHGNERLTHNEGAMESEGKGWRNANDGAKEAEGTWRNAGHQQAVPLTHDVGGWREAEVGVPNEKLFNHPNGEMRNNQEDTSRGMLENKSAENRIEES